MTSFPSRLELFDRVESTQRIVREWLDGGTPGVCVAVADEQTAGRGRLDRSWTAPPGAALLASAGFTPSRLPLRHAWRLAATVALAMIDAAEAAAGLRDETVWIKWPNDLVADGPDGRLLKLAGVLGETQSEGDLVASAVIGIGVNVDWLAATFPVDLAPFMTSLREISGGRPVDRDVLLDGWLARLEPRMEALTAGAFDAGGWTRRQRTTGRHVEIDLGDRFISGQAVGVDPEAGALLIDAEDGDEPLRIDSGEVIRCRIVDRLPRASTREGS
ncbi:MAG: biotin--[acetyl-CoA-carboxylase] ligase [Chloroflexota bacterium]|nr:biotin--[acetyl-CoA-carboxylase] ligase [Chloroflexota bacterium]